jgi:hypothetical protein
MSYTEDMAERNTAVSVAYEKARRANVDGVRAGLLIIDELARAGFLIAKVVTLPTAPPSSTSRQSEGDA